MKHALVFLLVVACPFVKVAPAQTYWASEVTIQQTSYLTVEATIHIYTKGAPLQNIVFHWGDGTEDTLTIDTSNIPAQTFYANTFRATHTYNGVPPSGYYVTSVVTGQFPSDIQNISGTGPSVHIDTVRTFNPSNFKPNHSASFLKPPVEIVDSSQAVIHNVNASDPDGDSLSFALLPVPNLPYNFPAATDSLYITQNGVLKWDQPTDTGKYFFIIKSHEWRDGVKIGATQRMMTVHVKDDLGDTSTHVSARSSAINFKVAPNPVDRQLTVSFSSTKDEVSGNAPIEFQLFNLQGQNVFQSANITSSATTLQLPDLPQGVYLYQARTNKKQLKTGKLVVE